MHTNRKALELILVIDGALSTRISASLGWIESTGAESIKDGESATWAADNTVRSSFA